MDEFYLTLLFPQKIPVVQSCFIHCFPPRHSDPQLKSGHDEELFMPVPLMTPNGIVSCGLQMM